MGRKLALNVDRLVAALPEQARAVATQAERARDDGLLDAAIAPICQQVAHLPRSRSKGSRGEIHWPAIVGIDQAEVPVVRALIEIRHARNRELEENLGKAVHGP